MGFPKSPCRPRMLKDFLSDDSSSCSANGFNAFPRKTCDANSSMAEADHSIRKNNSGDTRKLLRSRSKAAASATVSAFQRMIHALKKIPFPAASIAKSPPILPRSLSRRFSKRGAHEQSNEQSRGKITVTVKDIIRWRSFRDLLGEESTPSDLASSPHHCTTTTTVSTSSTPGSSKGSSWCDSDFTAETLPCWNGNSGGEDGEIGVEMESGKKHSPRVGEESTEARTETEGGASEVGPKEEEKQQHSPISVIEFEFDTVENEESLSSLHRSLATVQRTEEKLMEKIWRFEIPAKLDPVNLEEWMSSMDESNSSTGEEDDREEEEEVIGEVEEKARQLLEHAHATGALESCEHNVNRLVLDFLIDEVSTRRRCQSRIEEFASEVFDKAKAWINGEQQALLVGWEVEEKREAYLREIDEKGSWRGFGGEQEELALAVENRIVGILIEEVLLDLLLIFELKCPGPDDEMVREGLMQCGCPSPILHQK